MSLGETIDQVRLEHINGRVDHTSCQTCDWIDRIQKAYEELMASLNVMRDEMSFPIGYESVLIRDPDFEKEEAA